VSAFLLLYDPGQQDVERMYVYIYINTYYIHCYTVDLYIGIIVQWNLMFNKIIYILVCILNWEKFQSIYGYIDSKIYTILLLLDGALYAIILTSWKTTIDVIFLQFIYFYI